MKKNFLALNKAKVRAQGAPKKDDRVRLSALPLQAVVLVARFLVKNISNVLFLKGVCRQFRVGLQEDNAGLVYEGLLKGKAAKGGAVKQLLAQSESRLKKEVQLFQKGYGRLFEYGSTRQNVANKLVGRLGLSFNVRINALELRGVAHKHKQINFNSYFQFKLEQVQKCKFGEDIRVRLEARSKTLRCSASVDWTLRVKEVLARGVKEKAFCYYHERNLLLTYFEGDDSFLYLLLQVSFPEVIQAIRASFISSKRVSLRAWESGFPYESLHQYVRNQTDFEVHLFLHSDSKQSLHYCNTKAYPLKEPDSLHFLFRLDEPCQLHPFLLDNKLGMSEKVQHLAMMELLVKDRDRLLLCRSGFVRFRDLVPEEKRQLEGFLDLGQVRALELVDPKYRVKLMATSQAALQLQIQIFKETFGL